jgi:N-acetylglucosamine kinase-like BadF-type ATPase
LLGDEGGAYRLVVWALQAVARQLDGRGPATELTNSLLHVLQVNQPLELPRQAASWDRARLAGLATRVMQLAADQDAVAEELVARAADELAGLVACLMRRLGWGELEFPLALSGGLLLNHPQFVALLQQSLQQQRATPACVELVHDAVQGALLLACR